MKTLAIFSLLSLFSPVDIAQSAKVYVCNSAGSDRYHLSKSCRGLKNCEHQIIFVSVEKARTMGKTLCKWED